MFGRKAHDSTRSDGWSLALATALYRLLSVSPGNLAFSPWSISVALAMLHAGADAETRREIEAALGQLAAGDALVDVFAGLVAELSSCTRAGPSPVEFWLARALWCQAGYPVRPEFLVRLGRLGAETREVDFVRGRADAARCMNAWVAEATRQRIPEILSESQLSPLTRVILANACYFNAPWLSTFDEDLTRPAPFRLSAGATVHVPTMHQLAHYPYARRGNLQALEVPYSGGRFAMVILLPDEGQLESGAAELGAQEVGALIAATTSAETWLSLPRFRMRSSGLSLRSPLEAIGVKTAFGRSSDLSGISTEPGFALDDVVHGAFVDVGERGTEAAAATTADIRLGAERPTQPIDFCVDRPFLLLLRDRPTGTILFMGRVVDPRE